MRKNRLELSKHLLKNGKNGWKEKKKGAIGHREEGKGREARKG